MQRQVLAKRGASEASSSYDDEAKRIRLAASTHEPLPVASLEPPAQASGPTIMSKARDLARELEITATALPDVVNAACDLLGVAKEGLGLLEKVDQCYARAFQHTGAGAKREEQGSSRA